MAFAEPKKPLVLNFKDKHLQNPVENLNLLRRNRGLYFLLELVPYDLTNSYEKDITLNTARGLEAFERQFPKDMRMFAESVVDGVPKAVILLNANVGLAFVECSRVHPAWSFSPEKEELLRDVKDEFVKLGYSGPENGMTIDAKIDTKHAAPFLKVNAFGARGAEIDHAINLVHTAINNVTQRYETSQDW